MRARYMRTFVAHVDRLSPAEAAAIRSAIPQEILRQIETAGPLAWIPLAANVACTRAVAAQLGPARTHLFFRSLLSGTLDSPLLRGLVQGVLRVAVKDPSLYLPWVGRGFEVMFRDVGRFTVTGRRANARPNFTELTGLPAECDGLWVTAVASGFSAVLDLIGREGGVLVDQLDLHAGRAVFKWTLG